MTVFYIVDQNSLKTLGRISAVNGNAALISFLRNIGQPINMWNFNRVGKTCETMRKDGIYMLVALQKKGAKN